MLCPYCKSYPGTTQYRGYCSRVHRKLARKGRKKLRLPCKNCGKVVERNPSAVAPSGNVFCSQCGKNKGEMHPRWGEGQYINKDGYREVLKDDRYQREHRVIWEESNKACLLSNGTIHHIDFDKLNNSPDNLVLLSNQEHGRIHRYLDVGRLEEAGTILRSAGLRQYHYPVGVDHFIQRKLIEREAKRAYPSEPA